MPTTTSGSLSEAFVIAARTGLRLTHPDGRRDWSRLSCPACGAVLDLPTSADRGDGLAAARGVRRVTGFVFRHQPGQVHR
ncbi:MAG: hypothetical protein HKP61_10530 [Dactylosporangium sp.]|nr:hypothetical protein [Dactylosporangium sp.]NNJ61365.1 hypothetical protein [Dactylosporangium sp.]